ncbi:hypothetical protein [uncultured Roseobacter sp.]|uniref:hypothetical protein n=1 Tax=uncultured Roseobacter sp. TaxID=114847 RepID=UPI0026278572|nr:hypothetical protein [uncultured Roseobacter sp.]
MSAVFDVKDCSGVTIHKVGAIGSGQFVKARSSNGLLISECVSIPVNQTGQVGVNNNLEQVFAAEVFRKFPFAWECDKADLLALGVALSKAEESQKNKVLKESKIWPLINSQRGLDLANFCVNLARFAEQLIEKSPM